MKEEISTLNKKALIDEMANSINNMNEFINEAIESLAEEKSATSSLVGIAHQIGYLSASFNQFLIFERGLPDTVEQAIGFRAVAQAIADKKGKS
jgi:hypothetical protein